MSSKSNSMGHEIIWHGDQWVWSDTKKPIIKPRPCSYCNQVAMRDKDPCLIQFHNNPDVVAACCGHGVEDGYVLFKNGYMVALSKLEKHNKPLPNSLYLGRDTL